jgi:DNA end-binding protein Ku
MFGKEQVMLLRPVGRLLAMFALDYDFQVKKPAEFEDMLPKADVDPEELEMTKTLIEAMAKKRVDMAAYKDTSKAKLRGLVEAKVAGK